MQALFSSGLRALLPRLDTQYENCSATTYSAPQRGLGFDCLSLLARMLTLRHGRMLRRPTHPQHGG
jgi:hypothetical protein